MSALTSESDLGPHRRWRLAWALTWPSFVFSGLLWASTVGAHSYLNEQSAESTRNVCQSLFFFLIAPWIVRRTVRRNFSGFCLIVRRGPAAADTRAMSYRESLSVAWLLAWRGAAVAAVLMGAIFVALWTMRGTRPHLSEFSHTSGMPAVIEFLVWTVLTLFMYFLWLVPASIHKTYSGFILQVRETAN